MDSRIMTAIDVSEKLVTPDKELTSPFRVEEAIGSYEEMIIIRDSNEMDRCLMDS
jgi:hypothetical protein